MKNYYIKSNKFSIAERQTKHGKVFDVRFRVINPQNGADIQKKLCGYKSKALAKNAFIEFITENCEFVKDNKLKKNINIKKEELTVSQLYPIYIQSLHNQDKESSLVDKQLIFKSFYEPTIGNIELSDLTRDILFIWQDNLWSSINPKTNNFYSYAYLSKIRAQLNAFLSWVENRYEIPNKLKTIPKPKCKTVKEEMQIWTRDEFNTFIQFVNDPLYHAIFMTLFYTGRRKSEVLALTPNDITKDSIKFNKSLTTRTLDSTKYKITSTKANKVYSTPLSAPLKKEFESYKGSSPFFFGGENPIPNETLRRKFENYIKLAGLKKIRIHDLRHSFVSMLIHLGANLTVVADAIGDTLEQVTKTYAHLYEIDKINIFNKLY